MSGLVDDPETLKAAGRMRALGVEPVLIRPGTTDDRPFVFSTTLRGLLDATPHTAAPDTYHSGQLMLERTFERTHVLLVACVPEYPETILGYVLVCGDVLVSIVVKGAFREMGLGRALIEALGVGPTYYAFRVPALVQFLRRVAPQCRFNAIALMG